MIIINVSDFYLVDDKGHEKLLNEIKKVESTNYNLRTLVWVNFPMAYTQANSKNDKMLWGLSTLVGLT